MSLELDAALGRPSFERVERRRRAAVEERRAVVGLDEVDADRALEAAKCRSIGAARGEYV